jgi:hypothetical protein
MLIFYATYRRHEASIYGNAAGSGGGGQRQSATTNGTNPTNGMGILWCPFGTVSSSKCQVSSKSGREPRDCGLKEAGLEGVRAKRSQSGGRIVRNEPNFARPQAADGGNCAKRSQTWRDWGMWVKVVVWGVARPGSETCETNPISGPGAPRLRIRDCGLKEVGRGRPTPDQVGGRLYQEPNVQNEPNFGRLVGVPRRIVQNEPNSRRPGWDVTSEAWTERQVYKTNLISLERPGMDAGWWGRGTPPVGDCAKQDASDKSRGWPGSSLVLAPRHGSESDSGTFVVGIKQSQF